MRRTLARYQIAYNPPPHHPRKTVNALRLLHYVGDEERVVLSKALFKAYWVDGKDVADGKTLLDVVRSTELESLKGIGEEVFEDMDARRKLEEATKDAVERGAIGVPGFWIEDEVWTDFTGEKRKGRFYWGQDRMHFVEAALLRLRGGGSKNALALKSLMPRCIAENKPKGKVRLEFWYDFSSPWAFLGWTQLERLKRTFGKDLEIDMKPFLLGILFRE